MFGLLGVQRGLDEGELAGVALVHAVRGGDAHLLAEVGEDLRHRDARDLSSSWTRWLDEAALELADVLVLLHLLGIGDARAADLRALLRGPLLVLLSLALGIALPPSLGLLALHGFESLLRDHLAGALVHGAVDPLPGLVIHHPLQRLATHLDDVILLRSRRRHRGRPVRSTVMTKR